MKKINWRRKMNKIYWRRKMGKIYSRRNCMVEKVSYDRNIV